MIVVYQTCTLTTGVDTTLVGGAGDDTFTAVDTQVATTQTLTSGDSISGGAGTDTLTIAASGGVAVAAPLVASTGVEVINVTNNNTGLYTVDTSLMTGLTTVRATAGAADVTFSGQTKVLNAELISTNRDVTLSPASGTSGTTDAMSVVLNGAGVSRSNTLTANGIETMNVTSTGSASGNSTNSTRVTLASDALDVVNVTGAANARLTVNFAGASGLDVATLNASGTTGGVNASLTLGASGKASVVGGTGNDGFTFAAALTKDVTVSGGDGTDTITVGGTTSAYGAAYSATATTQAAANVSGFEVLAISNNGAADVRSFTNNTGFTSYEAAGASATLAGLSTAAATITAKGTGGTVAVTRATDAASGDTLTVKLAATTPGTFTAVSVADEEVLTIESAGTAVGKNTITTLTATDATSLTVTGSKELDITTLAGATNLATLNAGGHTGSTFSVIASNSTVAMTVTASAGVNATDGAIVNTITTGSGNDSITGGAYYDSLSGGIGNDTIIGLAGNDKLYGNANNDVIDGGDGNDYIDGDVGNDSLVGGAGNDTILASTGNDTVSGGDGNDTIYMASLSDDDSIDGGAGTDALSASDVTTTGAGPDVAEYVDVTDSVVARISGVETGYVQATTTTANTSASTALTVDFTSVTGMSTLWLDLVDSGANRNEYVTLKNFSGATLQLSDTSAPLNLTLDGTGQSLTTNLRAFGGNAADTLTFTGVDSASISATSVINSAAQTNVLGAVVANSATSVGVSTSAATAAIPAAAALTAASVTANSVQNVTLNAGAYTTLAITDDVAAADGLAQTLDIDVGTSATMDINGGDITLTSSILRTVTVDLLADANLWDNANGATVNVTAARTASATITVGANADLNMDLDLGITSGTATLSSGSTWTVDSIGRAAQATSLTISGTGDVDAKASVGGSIALAGSTASLIASSLVDADVISVHSSATTGATITGTAVADEISGGAGADSLTGGDGADRFGLTGRVETLTVTASGAADTYTVTVNGVATEVQTVGTGADGAGTREALATQAAAAINEKSATSFATATANGAVVTITYAQYFGTIASIAVTDVAAGTASAATIAPVTGSLGDNAGADTISAGLGQDTILGGAGIDVITITDTVNERDSVRFTAAAGDTNYDLITGFDVGAAGTTDLLLFGDSVYAFLGADGNGAGNDGTVAVATGATLAAVETADDDFTVGTISTNIGVLYSGFTAATPTVTYADLKAAVVTALGNPASMHANAELLILVDDGVSTGVWKLSADTTTNTTVAAELELLAVLVGVADATTVVANNIGFGG